MTKLTKFDSIQVGDHAEISVQLTKEHIDKFIDLTGDDNKLHHDSSYSKKTPFKKPVAHGMLSASFISTIIGTKIPGDGALWFSQNLEFLLPVRENDTITVTAEVIKKFQRDHTIELKTDVFNQNKQKVISGSAKVKVFEEEKEETAEELEKPAAKVALIIGASGGIGKQTCLQLAQDGFDVIIHYNKDKESALNIKEEVEKLKQKAILVSANIADKNEVHNMAESIMRHYDSITCLVNCTTSKIANIPLNKLEWEDFQKHIDVSIKGLLHLVQEFTPLLEKSKNGKIINISTQAIETPNTEWLPYITAKSALNGMTKALALELAPKKITVNQVSPGMTNTDLISNIPEKFRILTAAKTPLKRLAETKDIANAIAFLASEKAVFITGETLRVNGGQVML